MKRPKWVLRSFLLSLILLFVAVIQVQNSRAENDEDARARLLREMEGHKQAAAHHHRQAIEHASLASQANANLAACIKALGALGPAPVATDVRLQDCSDEFLRTASVGTRVSTTVRNLNGTTRVGAIFERVPHEKFQVAWQQISADGATRGVTWSERIGSFTNDNRNGKKSKAEKECEDRGGRLPTIDEFEQLRAGFDLGENDLLSDLGSGEFHRLFPDMKGHWFWSSSPVDNTYAFDFNGNYGYVYNDYRGNYNSVRCVR